jgi:hypothetical protein
MVSSACIANVLVIYVSYFYHFVIRIFESYALNNPASYPCHVTPSF